MFNLTLIAVKQATIMLWEVVFLDFYKLYLLLNRFVIILVLYSSDLGMYSTTLFMDDWIIIFKREMEAASDLVKHSIEISNQYRKKSTISESFGRILKKPDYNTYTEGIFIISLSFKWLLIIFPIFSINFQTRYMLNCVMPNHCCSKRLLHSLKMRRWWASLKVAWKFDLATNRTSNMSTALFVKRKF